MKLVVAIAVSIACALGCGKLPGGSGSSSAGGSVSSLVAQPAAPSPKVRITHPVRGSFLAVGPVAVQGEVQLVSATATVSSVVLDGQTLPVDGAGKFRGMATLREGLNILEAACTDSVGRHGSTSVGVLGGDYKRVDESIRDSTVVRIADPALDACGKLAEAALWNTDWTTVLKGLNPIYDTNFLWMKVWIDIDQVRFHDVHVSIDSRTGSALATIQVDQPILDVTIVVDLGFARIGPFTAVVRADNARVQAGGAVSIRSDGTFATQSQPPTTTFASFNMTVSNQLVDAAVQLFARNALERALRGFIDDSITQKLPPFLDRSIADFLQHQNPWLLLGKPFQIDVRGERIAFDDAGITFAARFNANGGPGTARAQAAPGSFSTLGGPPPVSTQRGFFVTSDDDGFNRCLHAMWAGAHFDAEIDEAFLQANNISFPLRLEAGSFRRFLPEIGGVIPDGAPVKIRTEAVLPPIIRMSGQPDLAVLQAGEFAVEILVDRRGSGNFEKLLRAVVHIELGGNVSLTGQGLEISSLSNPRFAFDLVEEPMLELDDRRLEVLLSVMLTPTVPHVLNSLRVIGIPHLNQLTTFNVDILVDGASRDHLVVAGDMAR